MKNSNNSVDDKIEKRDLKKVIREEMEKLSEEERKILVLYYNEGLSDKEIAEVMADTPANTTKRNK